MFYGEKINGITFEELNDTTKLKVLYILNKIDNNIENYVPEYKESIKNVSGKSYVFIKENTNILIENVETKIIEKIGVEEYTSIKNKITNGYDNVTDKSKEVYEKSKEKVKSWYENFKK